MAQEVYNYLTHHHGLPEHTALAVMDSYVAESGLNPGINERQPLVSGSRGGRGLYQLTGPRRTAFENTYGTDYDWKDQVDFMIHEGNTTEQKAWQSVLAAPDRASAVAAMTRNFLRPAHDNSAARVGGYDPTKDYGFGNMDAVNTVGGMQINPDGTIGMSGDVLDPNETYAPVFSTSGGGGGGDTASTPPIMQQGEDEGLQPTFHPGMALQSLGAAMASTAQGENAADRLKGIRDGYFREREAKQKTAIETQQREAMAAYFDQTGQPQLAQMVRSGGGADLAASMVQQKDDQGFQSVEADKQRGWQGIENQLGRELTQSESLAQRTHELVYQGNNFDQETSERVATQIHQINERIATQGYNTSEREAGQEFTSSRDAKLHEYSQVIQDAGFDQQTAERVAGELYQSEQDAIQRKWQTSENKAERDLASELKDLDLEVDWAQIGHQREQLLKQTEQWATENNLSETRLKQEADQWFKGYALDKAEFDHDVRTEEVQGSSAKEFVLDMAETAGATELFEDIENMDPAAFSDPQMVARYNDIITSSYIGAEDQTTLQKNLALAARYRADGDPIMAERIEASLLDQTSGSNTKAMVDYTQGYKDLEASREAMVEQRGKEGLVDAMVGAISAEGFDSGPAAAALLPFKSLLVDTNIIPADSDMAKMVEDQSAFNAISKALVPQMRPTNSGTSSDLDVKMYQDAVASMNKGEGANRRIARGMQRRFQQNSAYMRAKEDFFLENGHTKGFDAEFERMAKNGDVAAGPESVYVINEDPIGSAGEGFDPESDNLKAHFGEGYIQEGDTILVRNANGKLVQTPVTVGIIRAYIDPTYKMKQEEEEVQ